eukprot:4932758-Amphidinium_carterae.1
MALWNALKSPEQVYVLMWKYTYVQQKLSRCCPVQTHTSLLSFLLNALFLPAVSRQWLREVSWQMEGSHDILRLNLEASMRLWGRHSLRSNLLVESNTLRRHGFAPQQEPARNRRCFTSTVRAAGNIVTTKCSRLSIDLLTRCRSVEHHLLRTASDTQTITTTLSKPPWCPHTHLRAAFFVLHTVPACFTDRPCVLDNLNTGAFFS